ncbi:MAG: hypothetical protein ACXVW9_04395 [Nocardioidaceae bacterium]
MTGSHSSSSGRTTDTSPTQVTSRPPFSLDRITTSTRSTSSIPGSGCSSPPETRQSASSYQRCQTACERSAYRTQLTPVFLPSSAMSPRANA